MKHFLYKFNASKIKSDEYPWYLKVHCKKCDTFQNSFGIHNSQISENPLFKLVILN